MKSIVAFLLLLGSTPVMALQCEPGGQAAELKARAGHPAETRLLSCRLDNERALDVSASADSTLVRARAVLRLSFLDAAGRELAVRNSAPSVGQFRGLKLQHAVAVPEGARRLLLLARVEGKSAEAGGRFRVQQVQVRPALAVSLDLPNDGVINTRQPLLLGLTVRGPVNGARIQARVNDVDGKLVRQLPVQTLNAGGEVRVDAGQLPAGYYDVQLTVEQPGLASTELRRGLAVVAAGELPRERRIGLDTALSWYGGEMDEVRRQINLLRLAGVGTVRDRFSWSQVQKQEGQANWGRYLAVDRELTNSGFEVVQVFHDAPAWSRLSGAEKAPADRTPPTDSGAYALGQAFARGLGPHVRFVEFWNEQNSAFFAGYPHEYAQALKAFHAGVKSIDPGIGVLIGASAGKPGLFFDALYRNEVADAFDIHNQHFYGKAEDLAAFVEAQKALQQQAGTAGKPAWLTEIGYSLRRDASGQWDQAEREQASYLVKAYAEGLAAGYQRVFFFLLKELIEDDFHTWGLLRADLSPRPAYVSLATLTRHIQNAPLVAVLRSRSARVFYFRRADGQFNAIAWGTGAASVAGTFTTASDVYGRALRRPSALGKQPLFLAGLTRLPPGAVKLEAGTQPAVTAAPARWRLSGTLKLDDAALPRPAGNAAAVKVGSGQTLVLSGRLLRDRFAGKAAPAEADIECSASPGMIANGSVRHHVPADAAAGFPFSCSFTVPTSGWKQGFVAARVRGGQDQDSVYIPLQADIKKTLQRISAGHAVQALPLCGSWSRNASPNVKLTVAARPSTANCQAMEFRSEVLREGETWAFPGTLRQPGLLARAAGIRFEISELAGVPFPPRPFLLQLAEKSGIWLVELDREQLENGRWRYSGLFDSAKAAAWAPDKDGTLNLERVQQLMLGWGGYGGQAGQSHGYRLESMQLIPKQEGEDK